MRFHPGRSDNQVGRKDRSVGKTNAGDRRIADKGIGLHTETKCHATAKKYCFRDRRGDRIERAAASASCVDQ